MTWREKEIELCTGKIQDYQRQIQERERHSPSLVANPERDREIIELYGMLLRQKARLRRLDPDDLLV